MSTKPKCWRCKGSGKTVETEILEITDAYEVGSVTLAEWIDVEKPCYRCGGTGKDK